MPNISTVLITLNEEKNIAECLAGLSFCEEMIVVDSGSTDQTVKIASLNRARVFQRTFISFADQKNFGIQQASGEWILLIDADERVPSGLAVEITQAITEGCVDGYFVKRRNQILGRWMQYGINQSDYQLRLVRKNKARFEGIVHERIHLPSSVTERLNHPLLHYSTPNIHDYMRKLNLYTSLEVGLLKEKRFWVGRTLLLLRPIAIFLRRFFFQREFLDGFEGFIFCVLSAYYEHVRLAKTWERS